MPGSVANNFARNHARSHDDRVLGEREWEQFGQDLIAYDLEQRKYWMEQHRPDLALNLPVKDIQSAHDASFEKARIDPHAWTPRPSRVAAPRRSEQRRLGKECVLTCSARRPPSDDKKQHRVDTVI